jgi:hypothetical protein
LSAPLVGGKQRRSTVPGISAFSRHGVPASRDADRCRASATRRATTADRSPDAQTGRSARLAGRRETFTSTRSSSGPDSRPRYRRRTACEHRHPVSPGAVVAVQGHGLAARTRVKRAGNVACIDALAITTLPVSRGWRSASSTSLWNSGAWSSFPTVAPVNVAVNRDFASRVCAGRDGSPP